MFLLLVESGFKHINAELERRKSVPMMTQLKKLIVYCLLGFFCPAAGYADQITIVADHWPPFNLEANAPKKGYMIDIADAVFKPHGITVIYQNIPWNRALHETKEGNYNAVVGASKTDAEGFVFPHQELARNKMAFFIRENDTWQFEGVSSLSGKRLGAVDGYDYRQGLNAM